MKEAGIDILTVIVSSVLAGSFGLLGTWLGHIWNSKSTEKTVKLSFDKAEYLIAKQEFLKSAAEFESAFTEEIMLLEITATTNHKNSAQSIIQISTVKHKNAMIRFRPHVVEPDRPSFDNAWNKYKQYADYSRGQHEMEKEKIVRKLALDRIEKLLKFAK